MAITNKESFTNSIESFILLSEATVNDIINDLGWSLEHMWTKDDSHEICPLDSGHVVPKKSFQRHVELCSCVRDGYSKDGIESMPPDPKFCYEGSNNVVTVPFDEKIQNSVLMSIGSQNGEETVIKTERKVPKTMDRAFSEFTREERLAIYDYAVAQSKVVAKNAGIRIEEMNLNFEQKEDKEKPKSFLEVLAEQRDYKRRRQSYRAKNVHITKKSYTEVMREVIKKQMEYLDPEMKDEEEEKEDSIETANESSDGRNYRDAYSSREFGQSYGGRREDSRRRRSRSRSFGREKWRERSESNRTEDHYRERSRNLDKSSRDSRDRKRHRSRSPTRKIVSPKQMGSSNDCVSPQSTRHHRGSSRHRKKHKHRHHKRKSSEKHRD